MAWQISQRFGLPTPNSDSTTLAPLRANLELLVAGLESSATKYGQGVIASRPAASAATLGMVWTTPAGSAAWCDGAIWRSLLGSFVDARDYMTCTLINTGSTSGAMAFTARTGLYNVTTTPVEFQAAVDAARLAKLPLYLPAGEYWLGLNTTINVHNITMFGDGWDRTIIYYNNQTPVVFTPATAPTSPKVPDQVMFTTAHPGGGTDYRASDFQMRDLSITGNYARSLLDVAHEGTCLVERVRFYGFVAGALYNTNGPPNALVNVTPRINSSDLTQSRTAWVFRGCIFQNDRNTAGTPYNTAAMRIADLPGYTYGINGLPLMIENCTFQTYSGVVATGNSFKNVTFRGCLFGGTSSMNWQTQMPLHLDSCIVDAGDIFVEYTDIAYVTAIDCKFTSTQACFRWNGINGAGSLVVQGSLRLDRCQFLQDAASPTPITYQNLLTAGRIVSVTTAACVSTRDPTVTSLSGAPLTTAFIDMTLNTSATLLYQKHAHFVKLDPSTRVPTSIINV